MKRAVLWGLGLALGAFALLCVLNPLMGLVLLAEITGSGFGHPRNPPALAEGVDVRGTWTAKKGVPAERRWDTIVRRHFPPGTKVQDMLAVLQNQGFKVTPDRHVGSYDWGGMPCTYTVLVRWHEDDARITSTEGLAYSGCL